MQKKKNRTKKTEQQTSLYSQYITYHAPWAYKHCGSVYINRNKPKLYIKQE